MATESFSSTSFDYIVIGGGTAGLALASRLSEDAGVEVALIEAGAYRPDDPEINTPGYYGALLRRPELGWGIRGAAPASGAAISHDAAKVLGGTSAMNFMIWMRGGKADYDQWEALGNTGWNWDALLPYFMKSETHVPQDPRTVFPGASEGEKARAADEPSFLGRNGPIQVGYSQYFGDATWPAVQAMNARGIKTNLSPYSGDATGVYKSGASIDRANSTRSYSASAYYAAAAARPNFHVLTGAQATKVVFAPRIPGEDAVACGVEFTMEGRTFTFNAKREVIISCGALNTPKVLELSGIGSEKVLSSHGIRTVVDLPGVGENFQDHVGIYHTYEVKAGIATTDQMRINPSFGAQQVAEYQNHKTGMLADALATFAFFPLKTFLSDDKVRELSRLLEEGSERQSALYVKQREVVLPLLNAEIGTAELLFSLKPSLLAPIAKDRQNVTLLAALQHPFSRGSVHIHSADPLDNPVVDGRYLSHPFDVQALTELVKFCRNLAKTEPLSSIIEKHLEPSEEVEDYEKYTRTNFRSLWHVVGTAAMAPREIGGVVDSELRVYGTKNLRVVDASVIPMHVAAHPQGTVYAIAERAADMIKGDHTRQMGDTER